MNILLSTIATAFAMLLCFAPSAHAHSVGAAGAAATHERQWTNTATNAVYNASFLIAHDNEVYLEDAAGKVIHIPLSQLSESDRAFVEEHSRRIRHINRANPNGNPDASFVNDMRWSPLERWTPSATIILALSALLGVALMLGVMYRFRHTRLGARVAILCAGIVLSSSVLYLEAQTLSTSPSVIDSAFAPYKATAKTRWDSTYFYVESYGIPQHTMMVGITSWQQQVPVPQAYTGSNAWSLPLKPVLSSNPVSTKTSLYTGAIALAVNGIPIFNALNNRGDDAFLFGELDNFGGHCGKADDYHYHTAPLHLQSTSGVVRPIAYALDGFAIWGAVEPDGSAMKTLDSYNGHIGSDGVYHYHGTKVYPYTCGAMRGVVQVQGDQIVPQSRSTPIRPPLMPLAGAVITACTAVGTNGYSVEYTVNGKKGYVNYSWISLGVYTFTFIDVNGATTTATYRGTAINTSVRADNLGAVMSLVQSPNPFTESVRVSFTLTSPMTNGEARITTFWAMLLRSSRLVCLRQERTGLNGTAKRPTAAQPPPEPTL
jgi:YHYH protein/SLA1 homology domain 1, SHD1